MSRKGPAVESSLADSESSESGCTFHWGWVPFPPEADHPLLPRPGPVRFLGGVGRGRLTVPELAESGFPHVAGEASGSARCGGSRVEMEGRGVAGFSLWRPESPEGTWRLARRGTRQIFAGGRRGAEAA